MPSVLIKFFATGRNTPDAKVCYSTSALAAALGNSVRSGIRLTFAVRQASRGIFGNRCTLERRSSMMALADEIWWPVLLVEGGNDRCWMFEQALNIYAQIEASLVQHATDTILFSSDTSMGYLKVIAIQTRHHMYDVERLLCY